MSSFWSISLFWAFFLLFIVVALAFVIPPLLRRNARPEQAAPVDRKEANIAIYQDQLTELKADFDRGEMDKVLYEEAKQEIEKRLSEDVPAESAPVVATDIRWVGIALGAFIPVAAIALYVMLGTPEALLESRAAPAAEQGQHDAAPMIAALEAKLQKDPDNAEGWYMLARSYASVGKYSESANAFSKASDLLPDEARILADYADALAMSQGQSLQGKPMELINKALKINPNDEKSLNLAASAAYQNKDFALAATYWRRLLKTLPPDSDVANSINSAIAEADKLAASLGGLDNMSKPSEKGEAGKKTEQASQSDVAISGTVKISKELGSKMNPSDRVFIFAQVPQGPKMPIASLKIEAKQLPYRFKLDDEVSMSPNDKLSNHTEVMISARVSKSGQPMAQSGDLQGKVGPIKLGQKDVSIVIDGVIP